VVLGHEESVLAVLTEGAIGVLQGLAAFSASYGIMAHDVTLHQIEHVTADKHR
jgi:hypothetical protein